MIQHCFNDETKEKVPLWMPIRETGDTTYNTTFVTGEKAKFLLFVEAAPTASIGYAEIIVDGIKGARVMNSDNLTITISIDSITTTKKIITFNGGDIPFTVFRQNIVEVE